MTINTFNKFQLELRAEYHMTDRRAVGNSTYQKGEI